MSPLLAALVFLSPPSPGSERPGVVVMDLEAVHEVEQSLANILNDSLAARLKASKRFGSILSGSDMRAMLDLEQQKQALDCDDQSCLAEIGGALGVPYLVHANLGRVGASYVLSVKLMDVNAAKVLGSHVLRLKSEDDLLDGIDTAVDKAVAEAFPVQQSVPVVSETTRKTAPSDSQAAPGRTHPPKARRRQLSSTLLLGSGVLAMGGGVLVMAQAQSEFDQAHEAGTVTGTSIETLERQFQRAHLALGGGAIALSLGVIAKVYWP